MQFILLLGLMAASVFAEILSLSAVVPFIGILAAPEKMMRNDLVAMLARWIGAESTRDLVLSLTILFGAAAIAAAAVRLLLIWASTRYTFAVGAEISLEIYRKTLYQSYEVHIRRGTSEVISGIATKIGSTMLGVVLPGTVLVSQAMLLLAVMAALLFIDPLVAMISAVGFGLSYALVSRFTNEALRRNGTAISVEQTQVVKALQEGLGGIRDVLLDGSQPFYCDIYRNADRALRKAQGVNIFIAQSPRPVVEALGMVLIAGIAYALNQRDGGIAASLPSLAALALGAQRLLPALQSIYASWASILGSEAMLADTLAMLDQPISEEWAKAPPEPLAFRLAVEFRGVRFRYAPDAPLVLDGFDLELRQGARIGIVGGTGSGKSTTVDLLMGLLRPTEGQILIDGQPLDGPRVRAWQRNIAHVPQSIYLTDATIAENIAFGVPRALIDSERVRDAARRAQIADFIESGPAGYEALVGERGVKLSGGQRQRIGIARALYRCPSVLVLDEATSALDNVTERSVMDAIEGLDRSLTILVIAHRLSTVRRCDTIVQVENGRVVAQGDYDGLVESSQSFRQLARAATI
jgi:ATP-binding cassette, subfamily B, bacterial PglK